MDLFIYGIEFQLRSTDKMQSHEAVAKVTTTTTLTLKKRKKKNKKQSRLVIFWRGGEKDMVFLKPFNHFTIYSNHLIFLNQFDA